MVKTGALPRTNRRKVYDTLRTKMLTLELPPGAALSENELAAALGVSRTPVRESLILLSEEGLVQVFPQIGSFVSRVDPERVADAQFLREAVELASLEGIRGALDTGLIKDLQANLHRQHAPDIDLEEFFALDEEFHQGLLRLGGHGNAWPTVVAAKGHLDRARRLGLHESSSSPTKFADQHQDVLRAVLAGDIELAKSTMRQHLRAVFDDIERIQARSPELFATSASTPVRRSVAVWQ
jgi:DNA-binding GntR family transcriptional regulator